MPSSRRTTRSILALVLLATTIGVATTSAAASPSRGPGRGVPPSAPMPSARSTAPRPPSRWVAGRTGDARPTCDASTSRPRRRRSRSAPAGPDGPPRTRRPRSHAANRPGQRAGLVLRPQQGLDPLARHPQVGVGVRLLVERLPREPRLPLGLCRLQQHLPVRSRPQRLQAAPRRLRPRPPREGHEGPLRGCQRPCLDLQGRAGGRSPTPDKGEFAYASQSRPSMTLQTCVGAKSQYRLIVRLVKAS